MDHLCKDERWLRQKYVDERLSSVTIGKIAGCDPSVANYWLRRFGIRVRSLSEAKKLYYESHDSPRKDVQLSEETKRKVSLGLHAYYEERDGCMKGEKHSEATRRKLIKYPQLWDGDWLQEHYWDKWMSTPRIAKLLGCDTRTVYAAMKKRNIPIRSRSEASKNSWRVLPRECHLKNIRLSKATREIIAEKLKGRSSHMKGKKHSEETKEKIKKSVQHFFDTHPEVREKLSFPGKKNPAWRGGTSYKPYPFKFGRDIKKAIRRRDKYTCQICGCSQKENLKKYRRRLSVHHINHIKSDCSNSNLIALCTSCHGRVDNQNREWWEQMLPAFLEGEVNYLAGENDK